MFYRNSQSCGGCFRQQRGAVLFVGLIILLLMTMIGVTAIQVTTQQERMAGNLRDRNIAFQAAEIGLIEGERAAWNATVYNGNGSYRLEGAASVIMPDVSSSAAWTGSKSQEIGGDIKGTAARPRYMMEYQEEQGAIQHIDLSSLGFKADAFRVVVRAVGGRGDTPIILESTYTRPYAE